MLHKYFHLFFILDFDKKSDRKNTYFTQIFDKTQCFYFEEGGGQEGIFSSQFALN